MNVMTLTYLWNVLDEGDGELDVGEVVQVCEPGDHPADRQEQGDE